MGNTKKKEILVAKPSVGPVTIISTLKQLLPKELEKPEVTKDQMPAFADTKEIKIDSGKVGEVSVGGNARPPIRPPIKLSDFTGKDRQRYWEWVKFKTPIKVKLINGEIFEGYLKWYDQFAVKLVTTTDEIVIPKHSILCIFDEPKSKPEAVVKDT